MCGGRKSRYVQSFKGLKEAAVHSEKSEETLPYETVSEMNRRKPQHNHEIPENIVYILK